MCLIFFFFYLTSGKEVEMFTEEYSDSELTEWDAFGMPLYKMG